MSEMQRLQKIFRTVFDRPEMQISRTTKSEDIVGWDSLKQIELIICAEQEYGVKVEVKDILQIRSVLELAQVLGIKEEEL